MRGCTLGLLLAFFVAGCGDTTDATSDSGADTGTDDGGSCLVGRTRCGAACVDLMEDNLNCGECGLACGDSVCNLGRCDSTCPSDTVVCGVRCCPRAAGCDGSGSTCAPPVPVCPTEPPTNGANCGGAVFSCVYARCSTVGEVSASCDGTWSVTTAACDDFFCSGGSETCTGDQVCVELAGGALLLECRANPCGEAAIEASCACATCPSGAACAVNGRTVTCNTCPSGLCP